MGVYVRKSIYKHLKRNIISITLLVSFIPLIFLGIIIYLQFATVYEDKIEEEIKRLALLHCNTIEVFLKERKTILTTIVDTHNFNDLRQQDNLTNIFKAINRRADSLGLVDLGVINSKGNHLAYAGPYNLKELNYGKEPWFHEVISKGVYISDVYMGFRQLPHFIIAVRGYCNNGSWILRATIDSDIFNKLARTAQTGKTGDAYILNKKGIFQTNPRFDGKVLGRSNLDIHLFGQGTTVTEKIKDNGSVKRYAGSWLKNNEWILIISRNVGTQMIGLEKTRNVTILIICLGCVGIFITTYFTTQIMFKQLYESDKGITELNAQLIQSDKLAALGKMAAGIAHEINNPLAVIGEKAGWMLDLLEDEKFQGSENFQEYKASIGKIEEHVERARKITHNMLGFARSMEPHLDDVDVNNVLNQTIELIENHARINNIEIVKKMEPDLPIIASDQAQIQQVFMNLINNAIDAIEKNGTIEVTTQTEGSEIEICIKDNGPGITDENQRRVFDPFFTTKRTGKGTGLGLSISYSIIEKLGGTISLKSKPSQGSVFTIKLPLVIPEKK